jgi:hypothetical protein
VPGPGDVGQRRAVELGEERRLRPARPDLEAAAAVDRALSAAGREALDEGLALLRREADPAADAAASG